MQVKSRHHLRSDRVSAVEDDVAETLGVDIDGDSYELVEFEDDTFDLVLVDGEPLVVYVEPEGDGTDDESPTRQPFLTVRGANELEPTKGVVTVDAGAISFVSDGADVMRPGIVAADDGIRRRDLVAIAEEAHGKFLAIGRALVDGTDMVGEEGRVVESIHHVGDEIYEWSP
jgi:PUA domain protein